MTPLCTLELAAPSVFSIAFKDNTTYSVSEDSDLGIILDSSLFLTPP